MRLESKHEALACRIREAQRPVVARHDQNATAGVKDGAAGRQRSCAYTRAFKSDLRRGVALEFPETRGGGGASLQSTCTVFSVVRKSHRDTFPEESQEASKSPCKALKAKPSSAAAQRGRDAETPAADGLAAEQRRSSLTCALKETLVQLPPWPRSVQTLRLARRSQRMTCEQTPTRGELPLRLAAAVFLRRVSFGAFAETHFAVAGGRGCLVGIGLKLHRVYASGMLAQRLPASKTGRGEAKNTRRSRGFRLGGGIKPGAAKSHRLQGGAECLYLFKSKHFIVLSCEAVRKKSPGRECAGHRRGRPSLRAFSLALWLAGKEAGRYLSGGCSNPRGEESGPSGCTDTSPL